MKKLITIFTMLLALQAAAQYGPADSALAARVYQLEVNLHQYRQERNKAIVWIIGGALASSINVGQIANGNRGVPLLGIGGAVMTLVGVVNYHQAHRHFRMPEDEIIYKP
jgi:hypothetical protein